MELKFNGNIIEEGKINGQIISFVEPSADFKINNNSNKHLTYYFADNNGVLDNYTSLFELESGESFDKFNELNTAPSNATKIVRKRQYWKYCFRN